MDPEVGNEVEESKSRGTNSLASKVQSSTHESQANVGDEDEDALLVAKDSTSRLKVADVQPPTQASRLLLKTSLASGGVEQEVCLPSEELVEDEADALSNRSILKELAEVDSNKDGRSGGLGLSGRDESHVLLHMAVESMVTVVRILPGKVGNQKE